MESLLTISIGEYTTVEISLRLTVALISMTAVLMALASGSVSHRNRIALILPAVALGGAAWFESGVWVGWKEAFELTGSAYCVTGHLLAGEDRIIAWSLGVPAILFAIGIVCLPRGRALERLAAVTLALALATPFSNVVWVVLYGWIYWQIGSCLSGSFIKTLHPCCPDQHRLWILFEHVGISSFVFLRWRSERGTCPG